jgi:hypothetical protein
MTTIRSSLLGLAVGILALVLPARASVLTVTTTNNVTPGAGQLSLAMALQQAKDGDQIQFNIPGTGPQYIQTPTNGYPYITNNNITINGYSQPGSAPNTGSILAPNSAKIQIVLDSRGGGFTSMSFKPVNPNDDPGYDSTEGAVLGLVGAQGFKVQGVSFLGTPTVGTDNGVSLYFISFALGASGQVSGCWLGVDPDGKTVAGASDGVTGFRYRMRDASGTTTNSVLVNGMVIGVAAKATNAVQQFNVFAGSPGSSIIVEGDATRISGNFIAVLPDGLHDVDPGLDSDFAGQVEAPVEIGRSGNNTLIGTDGDGVNDENERNVFGGMVPTALGGYDHLIEFYSPNPATNVVFAGNYVGVGIDGKTRFTNGVPVLNAAGAAAQYRVGSDFDGVSDAIEGNLIANNYPSSLFPASGFQAQPDTLSFFDQLSVGSTVSLRGNSLIDNFPFPASPDSDNGSFLANYYAPALLDPTGILAPVLATNSTHLRLTGRVPVANPDAYSSTVLDLYVADPEGMTNGMAAGIADLPQGFVQGRTYLGSVTVPASAATNTPAGSFDLDITKLNVPAGTQLTATANYIAGSGSSGDDGQAPSFTAITRAADGTITLTWDRPGILQSAPAVTGSWTQENATGTTFTTTATDPIKFFRLQAGAAGPAVSGPPLTSPFSNVVKVN